MANEKKILDMFNELLGNEKDTLREEEEQIPYQMFCFPEDVGSEAWVLDTMTRTMIRAFNHSEVVKIGNPDENNKVLVRYSGTFVRVPAEYVCDIGFN